VSRLLFIQADSRLLNPLLDRGRIDAAYADDPEAAKSEWGGEFRSDISQFLPDELIDAAIIPGRFELPWLLPLRGTYHAFCDPGGGVRDSMTLAISHKELGRMGAEPVVLDQLHTVPAPYDPIAVARGFAAILQRFELHYVLGDRYSGEFCVSAFRSAGIRYEHCQLDKSAVYGEVLPLFAQKRVELLDQKPLITELRLLERRPRAGGRGDSVDHPGKAHDDRANACAGALWRASVSKGFPGAGGRAGRPEYSLMISQHGES
jgi:hypothetical protein